MAAGATSNATTGAAPARPAPSDDEILGLETGKRRAETPRTPGPAGQGEPANSARRETPRRRPAPGDGWSPSSVGSDAKAAPGPDSAPEAERPARPSEPGRPEENEEPRAGVAEPEELRGMFEANPELRRAWLAEKAYREIFPSVAAAREIQKIFPTVEEARAAGAQLSEIERLDAMFFSNHPAAHAELAAAIFRLDPQAFRSLAQAMAAETQRHAEAGPPAAGETGKGPSAEDGNREAAPGRIEAPAANEFASFYQEANAAAVEAVVEAIEAQVDRLLPEGVAPGVRNRVVGEIYRELDASLRDNRALARQVRQAFRSGPLDAAHQRAVVGLIVGRTRQALPGVAKRVIGEWTSSVLAAHSERRARQRAAESRVDISGHGSPRNAGRRPFTPEDIDYSKMSDADILNL